VFAIRVAMRGVWRTNQAAPVIDTAVLGSGTAERPQHNPGTATARPNAPDALRGIWGHRVGIFDTTKMVDL
jgi:hypothetical protein